MGGGCSNAQRYVQPDWNMPGDYIKIKNKYISCNLVTANCSVTELELCVVLNDTIGLRHLTKFSETVNKNGLIECWNDIIDYDTSSNFRRERLNKICSNYRNLSYLLENIPNQFENGLQKLQNIGTLLPEVVPVVMKEIFENARVYCFKNIHSLLWLDFMQLETYHSMVEMMLSAAHHTSPDDFEYLNKIAEGGFGLVLHCRKKDTGVCYAMKVQPKAALLKFFRRKPGRVIGEMQAYAVFRHPYIAKLSYAFQTPTLAIMVMPVCACGDLRKSASLTSCGRMALARVKFYSAEIVSALKYLHSHGILYRDLKPANVLLNSDGHIMLADFGSLADVGDKIGSTFKEKQAQLHSKASNGTIINGAIIEGDDRSYSMSTSNSNPPGKFLVSSTSAPDEAQVVPESNSVGKSCAHPASNPNSNPRSNSNANSALTTHEEEDTPKPQPEIESKPEVEPAPEVEPVSERDASRVKFDVSTKDGNLPLVSLKNRSSSLVGTLAYMAPEILIMFGKKRLNKDGYTDAVDWWSLGVTVYKLLTGYEPYRSMSYDRLRAIFPSILAKYNNYYSAFVSVFGKVNYFESEDILDADTINFIKRLLEFDSEKRLGAGNNGSDVDGHGALMSHPFFDGIDWEKLEKKQVQPPYIPEYETMEVLKESTPRRGTGAVLSDDSMSAPSDSVSCSVSVHRQPLMFNEMLKSCNKGAWIACGDNSSLKHALTTSGKKASAKGDQNSASMASGALSKRFWYFGNMSLSVTKHSSSVSNSKGGGKDLNKGENPAQYFVSESDQDYFKDWEFVAPELAITSQGSDYKSMSRSGKKTKTSDYSSTSTSSRNKEKSVRM